MMIIDGLLLIFSLFSLLVLAKISRQIAGRFKISPVLLELLIGIFIGPSLLGKIYPEITQMIFPSNGTAGDKMQFVCRITVMLLLLMAGMETNIKTLWKEGKTVLATTFGSFISPFILGVLLVLTLPTLFQPFGKSPLLLALFVGVALSISALPVIIRILTDLGLHQTRIGTLTFASASIMDLLGWTGFSVILYQFHPIPIQNVVQFLWSHSSLLCFLLGILLNHFLKISLNLKQKFHQIVLLGLSPIFFISIGAKLDVSSHFNFVLIAVIIVAAYVSKLIGTYLGARLASLKTSEILAISFALNARGAMEIILGKEALDAGLIHADLYVALVIMAMITSISTVPAIQYLVLKNNHKGKSYASTSYAKAT